MNQDADKGKFFKGIGANILLLGIVSFLNDLSSEMIMPTLPMFIRSLGGGSLAVGLLGGIRDSLSSFLNVFSGYWSDKTGKRKIFVFSGYCISSVFKFLLGLSKIWPVAVAMASAERFGKGLRTAARDAIIAESSTEKNRGRGFGIHRAFDTFGAVFGSLAVFLLYEFFNASFKFIILASAIISFISLVPIFFVKESRRKPHETALRVGFKNLPTSLKLFVCVAGVFALGNFSYMFFIMRAQQSFTGKSAVAIPLLLYVLFNIFYAVFAIPLGIASDKFGRRRILALGYLLFAAACFGLAFLTSLGWLVVLFAVYGLANAAIDGNQRAFISDLSFPQVKATALGAFHTAVGLMALPASLIAGVLWKNAGAEATFIYGGVIGAVCVLLLTGASEKPALLHGIGLMVLMGMI